MRVHHVGYIVADIESFANSLPGLKLTKLVTDELQNARLAIYRVGDGSNIELIQPLSEEAFTFAHLRRNGDSLHHICYEGIDAVELNAILRQHRMLKVRGPIFAKLFDREVVFAVTRQKTIVEFLL
jgi:catechol 2,3-dioxygenase-like lactoylglutathione lyase family enzyme